jgi:hypothetical protein
MHEQDLWRLLAESRLIGRQAQAALQAEWAAARGATAGDAAGAALAAWLVDRRRLSPYQAQILLAGRPGPLVFGKYVVTDRIADGRLRGLFPALHRPTRCPVLLDFVRGVKPGDAAWGRLAAQVSALSRLSDERLVRCYDLVHKPPYAFVALENLRGETAAERLGEARLEAAEAYGAGLSHGAVSAESVWFDREQGPRLLWLPAMGAAGSPETDVRQLAALLRGLVRLPGPGSAAGGELCVEAQRVATWLAPEGGAAAPSAIEAAGALIPLAAPVSRSPRRLSQRRRAYLEWLADHPPAGDRSQPESAAVVPSTASTAERGGSLPNVAVRAAAAARPRPALARKRPPAIAVALGVAAGLLLIGALAVWSAWPDRTAARTGPSDPVASRTAHEPAQAQPAAAPTMPADDGRSLWGSPTSGQPLSLELVGPGAQLLLALRPAELWANDEGRRLIGSAETIGLDPAGWLEFATGLPIDQLEAVLLAAYPVDANRLELSLVVLTPQPIADLPARWPGTHAVDRDGHTIYEGDAWSYFVPADGGRLFAAAGPSRIVQIASAAEPPTLRRELEVLWSATDRQRQATLVVVPAHFFSAGQAVLTGPLAAVRAPLERFLGEGLAAASVSLHLDGANLFLELVAVGRADTPARTLASDLQARLDKLPADIKAAVRTADLRPYGREVLWELPRMVEELAAHTRSDVEQGRAVLRAYLPARAAHNLALGGALLALETGRRADPVAAPGEEPAVLTLSQRLERPITLGFPRETFASALRQWGEATGISVSIAGNDLETEGITQNQSFGLEQTDQPAGRVLRQILLLASPQGKLVYVVKAEGAAGQPPSLLITTRAAALQRGDRLPAEFAPGEKRDP